MTLHCVVLNKHGENDVLLMCTLYVFFSILYVKEYYSKIDSSALRFNIISSKHSSLSLHIVYIV